MENRNIIRVMKGKENPYVMIDKRIYSDSNLSWKAKGILSYLLSKPDNWRVQESDIIKQSKDGRDSVRAGLKELIEAGYMKHNSVRNESGKILFWEYQVFEVPTDQASDDLARIGFSTSGFPTSGFSTSGKSDTTNKDLTNKDLTKNEYRRTQKRKSPSVSGDKYESFYL